MLDGSRDPIQRYNGLHRLRFGKVPLGRRSSRGPYERTLLGPARELRKLAGYEDVLETMSTEEQQQHSLINLTTAKVFEDVMSV